MHFEKPQADSDENDRLANGDAEAGDYVCENELVREHRRGEKTFEDAFFLVLGEDKGDGEDGHLHDG